MQPDVKILKTELLSSFRHKLTKWTYEMTHRDGSRQVHQREAYDRGNGAVILLYNKKTRSVILTRQFRLPTFLNGNPDGMMIEACAGLLDNEDPESCIIRETAEETGYQVEKVEKVLEAYMSPGSVTEILYFFVAEYTPAMKVREGGGLAAEQEDIEVLEMNFDAALQMINDGKIRDAKTILLLQHLQLKGRMD